MPVLRSIAQSAGGNEQYAMDPSEAPIFGMLSSDHFAQNSHAAMFIGRPGDAGITRRWLAHVLEDHRQVADKN